MHLWLLSLINNVHHLHQHPPMALMTLRTTTTTTMSSNSGGGGGDGHNHKNKTWTILNLILLLLMLMNGHCTCTVWEQKGCHIVGHTQKIDIPGCINFELTSNACRGYCVSYAIPSNQETLLVNEKQLITSVGNCCTMTETEVMSVRVMCKNGPRDIKFKSATKCGCFHCKKY